MAFVKRPFQIISEQNGKALDVKGGQARAGVEVIMWGKKNDRSPNQLWYNDQSGCIRSMLNDFSLECSAQGARFVMQPHNGLPRQQWMWQGNKIVNKVFPHECLDIERANNNDGANLVAWAYKGSANQHWRMQFI